MLYIQIQTNTVSYRQGLGSPLNLELFFMIVFHNNVETECKKAASKHLEL